MNILSEMEVQKIKAKFITHPEVQRLAQSHHDLLLSIRHLEKVVERIKEDHDRIRIKLRERDFT